MHISIRKALRSAMKTKSISFALIQGFQNLHLVTLQKPSLGDLVCFQSSCLHVNNG